MFPKLIKTSLSKSWKVFIEMILYYCYFDYKHLIYKKKVKKWLHKQVTIGKILLVRIGTILVANHC